MSSEPLGRPIVQIGVAILGCAGAVAVAAASDMGVHPIAVILGWAAGGAVVAVGLAVALLRVLRRRSAAVQIAVACLAPVVAVTAGVVGGSWAMFISPHDLRILIVMLIAAGTVGIVMALHFGSRVSRSSAELARRARRIGDGPLDDVDAGSDFTNNASGPSELVRLASELDAAMTRLNESRERENEAREREEAAERSRRDLVAWVSHDLRTPLAGIRAMVEALEDRVVDDSETVDRYHRSIALEVDRLSTLVSHLFELSKIHAGALELERRTVRLDDVVSDTVAAARMVATAKDVALAASASASPLVCVAPTELVRAVHNLLDNALRHTPAGGSVSIEISADHRIRAALLSVSDGCGGISEADLGRVFDVAFTGDVARNPGDDRAGLGLAVARGLVEAQSGTITVSNLADTGCRFTIELPLVSSDLAPARSPSSPAPQSGQSAEAGQAAQSGQSAQVAQVAQAAGQAGGASGANASGPTEPPGDRRGTPAPATQLEQVL